MRDGKRLFPGGHHTHAEPSQEHPGQVKSSSTRFTFLSLPCHHVLDRPRRATFFILVELTNGGGARPVQAAESPRMRTVGRSSVRLDGVLIWWQRLMLVSCPPCITKLESNTKQSLRRRLMASLRQRWRWRWRRMRHGGCRAVQWEMSKARAAACHRTERLMDDSGSEGDARHWSLRMGTLSGACAGLAPRLARDVPSYASELQSCALNPGKRGLADRTVRTGNARWLTNTRDGWAAGLPCCQPSLPLSAQTAGVGTEKQAQLTTRPLPTFSSSPNDDWLAAPLTHFLPSSSLRSQSPQIASYQQVVSFLPSTRGPKVPV